MKNFLVPLILMGNGIFLLYREISWLIVPEDCNLQYINKLYAFCFQVPLCNLLSLHKLYQSAPLGILYREKCDR